MTEKTARYRGFVVGYDAPSWKVRVKNPEGDYDGLKLVVASVRDHSTLARGLNVSFLIGTVDDEYGKEALRAVDVTIEPPSRN